MRATIYASITAIVLLSTMAICSAQNPSDKAKNKKSTVELFMPISQFFDEAKTNWFLLIKISPNSGWTYPGTLGFRYKREITNKGQLRFSVLAYHIDYIYIKDKVPSETMIRSYTLFSLGYLHRLVENKSLSISALIEAKLRRGRELFYITDFSPFESAVGDIDLKGKGLTAGIRAEQSLPFNFIFSTEVKYTRFILGLSEEIDLPEFDKPKRPSPDVFSINLGLGYRF